jgi:divalent metal cation (Fe/Co/Zn/Cd) transporter
MSTHVLSALRVSTTSAAWTAAASAAAIAIGVANESLALVAFGAVQLFDFAADVVLVVHFRAAHQGRDAEHLEKVVLRIVSAGLAAVGFAAVVVSIRHLADHQAAQSSTAAVVLAAGSFVFLAFLAYAKHHIAVRLPSRALHADGQLSAVGAVLAGVTLGGAAATTAFDWWWADPVAALLIGIGAIGLGVLTAKDAR